MKAFAVVTVDTVEPSTDPNLPFVVLSQSTDGNWTRPDRADWSGSAVRHGGGIAHFPRFRATDRHGCRRARLPSRRHENPPDRRTGPEIPCATCSTLPKAFRSRDSAHRRQREIRPHRRQVRHENSNGKRPRRSDARGHRRGYRSKGSQQRLREEHSRGSRRLRSQTCLNRAPSSLDGTAESSGSS